MFAANQALVMTLGLLGVFFIALPILVNVIVGLIAAQVAAERQDNIEYQRHHPTT